MSRRNTSAKLREFQSVQKSLSTRNAGIKVKKGIAPLIHNPNSR